MCILVLAAKTKMIFIEELKVRVIDRFGKDIKTKPDAGELRDMIFQQLKEFLSESTIRRFFGLIPSVKTSQTTMEILSKFIGFDSYANFVEFCYRTVLVSTKIGPNELILHSLYEKKNVTLMEANLIAYRIIQCITDQDTDSLVKYFNHEPLFRLIRSDDSIADLFAQTVGPYIEKEVYIEDLSSVLSTKYFIPLVLYKYVDIQNKGMERYYEWIIINHKNEHDLIFSASILSLNCIYFERVTQAEKYYQVIDKRFTIMAPVLNGRIALLDWYFSNDFDGLIRKAERYEGQLLFFSIDIMSFLVFFNKINHLKKWFYHFPTIHQNGKTWVEKEIDFFYKIAKSISEENHGEVKKQIVQKISMLNSDSTFSKIYRILESRYLS